MALSEMEQHKLVLLKIADAYQTRILLVLWHPLQLCTYINKYICMNIHMYTYMFCIFRNNYLSDIHFNLSSILYTFRNERK